MFSSSKRLERGSRILLRIITFLLQPFEMKRENVYILFMYGDKKNSFKLNIFDSEDFHGSLLVDDFLKNFYL